jgi:hypothetical protein
MSRYKFYPTTPYRGKDVLEMDRPAREGIVGHKNFRMRRHPGSIRFLIK